MVCGAIADPAPTSKPCLRLSPHTAPEYPGHCHWHGHNGTFQIIVAWQMQSLCWISRRKPCFHGQAVCLKPQHIESPCLPGHPPHVSISWALPQAFASWGILLRHSIRPGRLLKECHDGFPRSEYPLFRDLRMAFYAGSHSRGHHVLGYDMA